MCASCPSPAPPRKTNSSNGSAPWLRDCDKVGQWISRCRMLGFFDEAEFVDPVKDLDNLKVSIAY
jgi:hypothetical protein